MDPVDFVRRWKSFGPFKSLAFWTMMTFACIYAHFLCSRQDLARWLGIDDLKSRDEILAYDEDDKLMELIKTERDRAMVERLASHIGSPVSEPLTIGVIAGAFHARALARYLFKERYRPIKAQWLTVFSLDLELDGNA